MKSRSLFPILLASLASVAMLHADEREVTEEQQAAIENDGVIVEETIRPENLPDLTKGEGLPPSKNKPYLWHLGPTGISCFMSGGSGGDQLLVQGTIKGSPAEGKLIPGDVITGINGVKFQAGGNLGITIGNAIIEAEREVNGGKLTFQVWRDKNYPARTGAKDIAGTDIDELINQAETDDSLYDWKPEEARKEEVKNMDLDKFPIDPITLEVELKLRTFPDYADTAPYDCPKTKQILEDAWKSLEQRFVADPKKPRSGKGGVIEAMALVASGKPEHRELVKQWVRSKNCPWQPPTQPIGAMFESGYKGYKGYQTWHHGFGGLYCALYYDATGDEYVLPALRKYAIETAMGQSKAGTWGHTFAYPSFNGGKFHEMNPGYGALNAAGNRAFFLIALAQKLGVDHPEIDAAVKRSHRFFGSYVDQGALPYGDHPAANTDDSNGKNAGTAFAMKLIGDDYAAKYFAMMSAHASFTPRGGHAHDYFTQWSAWGATLCGPEIRTMAERNMRWRRTLCRMYDGSFVYHSPSEKYGTLRDPTATEVFHQAVILKQTLITGKDLDESLYPDERETKQFLASVHPQLNNDKLKNIAGKPWPERSTDELFDLLDIFIPKTRKTIAAELGKRFQAGESEIAPRLVALLTHENARYRHGALVALDACGNDTFLSNLSKITPLIEDPKDFVRITAIETISKASNDAEIQLALLETAVTDRTALAPNSVRNAIQDSLLKSEAAVSKTPFQSGLDEALVTEALSNLILEETGGGPFVESKIGVWDKDTVIRLAGPLTFIAEEEQVFDQMFANRAKPAQEVLGKFGYGEAVLATAHRLRKKAAIRRDIRPFVGYKRSLMDSDVIDRKPDAFVGLIDEMETVLTDNPIEQIQKLVKDKKVNVPLEPYYRKIKSQKKEAVMPSIADDAQKRFRSELDAMEGTGARIKLCRKILSRPEHKDLFRKIAAMQFLGEVTGADATEDLIPYLGHVDWRLREHSRKIAVGLIASGAGDMLVSRFAGISAPSTKAGILATLAASGEKDSLSFVKEALKDDQPLVRGAAAQALASLAGEDAIPDLLAHLKTANDKEELIACENALLSFKDNPVAIGKIRDTMSAMLPDVGLETRKTIHFILSRIGDTESIGILRKALETDDFNEFEDIIFALSYSPSRQADKVMLELAATDSRIAKLVGSHAMRRMVLGPQGFGDVTVDEKMDFAEAMLKMTLDKRLIQYVGQVYEARALGILMFCLEKGVESAAESLVACAEGMNDLTANDAKIAAQSLQDVIEYIEVTRLRGGIKAHMDKDDNYVGWKALQARAGKVLLKVHKPEEAPIPEFDPLEFE